MVLTGTAELTKIIDTSGSTLYPSTFFCPFTFIQYHRPFLRLSTSVYAVTHITRSDQFKELDYLAHPGCLFRIHIIQQHSKSSNNLQVLTSVCAVISVVAVDYQNVGIISDYDVVPLLAELTNVVSLRFYGNNTFQISFGVLFLIQGSSIIFHFEEATSYFLFSPFSLFESQWFVDCTFQTFSEQCQELWLWELLQLSSSFDQSSQQINFLFYLERQPVKKISSRSHCKVSEILLNFSVKTVFYNKNNMISDVVCLAIMQKHSVPLAQCPRSSSISTFRTLLCRKPQYELCTSCHVTRRIAPSYTNMAELRLVHQLAWINVYTNPK